MDEIPIWFVGSRLNYAENLLKYKDEKVALIETGEHGQIRSISYAELHERVRVCANALKKRNVGVGDRVAAYISNSPDAVVAMLATTSLGAIWTSASPDFGVTVSIFQCKQV